MQQLKKASEDELSLLFINLCYIRELLKEDWASFHKKGNLK